MSLDFRLVIPAFREVHRLPVYLRSLQFSLASAPYRTEILIVDDGSPLAEQKALREKIEIGQMGNCCVLEPLVLRENQGKGGAILAGWRQAGHTARWFGFVDADGAIPTKEVRRIFQQIFTQGAPDEVYFTSRLASGGRFNQRPPLRALAGLVFRLLVRVLFSAPIQDSQCGFKVIPGAYFPAIGRLLETAGFCFDVELLSAVRYLNLPIQEISIDWQDQRDGHINLIYHSPIMLMELIKIFYRGRQRERTTDLNLEVPLFRDLHPKTDKELEVGLSSQ